MPVSTPKPPKPPKSKNPSLEYEIKEKKKRLKYTIYRLESQLNFYLKTGHKELRIAFLKENNDILPHVIQYFNSMGWNVRKEEGYVVFSPLVKLHPESLSEIDKRSPPPPKPTPPPNRLIKEGHFPPPPSKRKILYKFQPWLEDFQKGLLLPFKLFWEWLKK